MIYPDLRVLLSLLMPGDNTQEASNLIREPAHVPLTLSIVHRLQVENALLRFLHGEDQQMAAIAKDGLLLWRQYLEEGVFLIRSLPLAEAFARATAWNAESTQQPPRWHLLIHVGLALAEKASFLSLDPLLRKRASASGIALIPARL
jgi:hypothetical protein